MKKIYFILMLGALLFCNEDVKAQAYACCNSDATDCAAGDGEICCSYVTTSGSPYTYAYCGDSQPGSSLKTGDFEQDLSKNSCNNTNDIDRLCQKSAPPKDTPLKK